MMARGSRAEKEDGDCTNSHSSRPSQEERQPSSSIDKTPLWQRETHGLGHYHRSQGEEEREEEDIKWQVVMGDNGEVARPWVDHTTNLGEQSGLGHYFDENEGEGEGEEDLLYSFDWQADDKVSSSSSSSSSSSKPSSASGTRTGR